MSNIVLTDNQTEAFNSLVQFITNTQEQVFVLSGYSGTGKSTLVKYFLDRLENIIDAAALINPEIKGKEVVLTATTNKAAENLEYITKHPVSTIHSYLGLRVKKDWTTGTSRLVWANKEIITNKLIFIDEGSYVDKPLLHHIFQKTRDCKIIFIGDPAQLLNVGAKEAPVFSLQGASAELKDVVRQADGNPIIELATKFRHTVNTGEFFSFTPDGTHVVHMDRADFDNEIIKEFTSPDWTFHTAKFLAWTNKQVTHYNQTISKLVKGSPHFLVGDYAVCNSYITDGRISLATDQMVCITKIEGPVINAGVEGYYYTLDNKVTFFGPKSFQDARKALNQARKDNNLSLAQEIDTRWIDLRPVYACTVNKSQGSTFDRVYIDLDDISRCRSGNQIARMLYVAVSRARHRVVLTGDLI